LALTPNPLVFKFGPYQADLRAGELRRHGLKLRLQEKPLQLLAVLAAQQGQIITREDLKRHLWAEDTFVDFETGLNTAVSKLRDALSDDAQKPRFIETVPRRGYRFIFPVEIIESGRPNGHAASVAEAGPTDSQSGPAISDALTPPRTNGRSASADVTRAGTAIISRASDRETDHKRSVWPLAVAVATLAISILAIWWLTPLPEPRLMNIYPVTATGKQDFTVRPATDGVRIFYDQRAGDHYELMQSSVNGGEAKKMDAPFPNTLIWDVSPDGSQYLITSFVHRGDAAPLWSWPATGGTPDKLGDLVSGSAAWSSDGKKIVYHAGKNLGIANADGTGAKILGTFQNDPDSPVWAPDGKRIRFTLKDSEHNSASIWEINSDGTGMHAILPNWMNKQYICCGTWSPDGAYYFFIEFTEKTSHLWALREKGVWWRRSPSGPFLVASEPTGSESPLIGRDGKHIFFYGSAPQTVLESMDVPTNQFSAFFPEMRPIMPGFSHDGQQVAYIQMTTGALWTSRTDGRDQRHIPFPDMNIGFPRWSPDGTTLAFAGFKRGEPVNTYLISAQGGEPKPVIPGAKDLTNPDWSPDGTRLVVEVDAGGASGTDSGASLAFVDLKNARMQAIPDTAKLSSPRWSPDGRFIAAVGASNRELEIYDIAAKHWRVAARGQAFGIPAWAADGTFLYYQDLLAAGEPLLRTNVNTGAVETVASFQQILDTGVHRCSFMAILPNGTPIVAFERGAADIYGATLFLP
jgi:Tol biopolymer transport system component/DNA-binding winged helix-turn-helix (wHTH) protein